MIRLTRMELTNFRKYETLRITFDPKVTVIVGGNGAGKSSVLDAAAIALGSFFLPFPTISQGRNIQQDDAFAFSKRTGEDSVDVRRRYPVSVHAYGEYDGREIEWVRSKLSERGNMTTRDARELSDIARGLYENISSDGTDAPPVELPLISYYGTGRLWAQRRGRTSDLRKPGNREDGYSSALEPRADEKSLTSWLKRSTMLGLQKGRVPATLRAVQAAVERAIRAVTGSERANVYYDLELDTIAVEYTESTGRLIALPMAQLSDGYRTTLSMIADIAYRMAELNPHFENEVIERTGGVVLIDEVDLHLHPTWQERIIGDLTDIFPRVQFIVTTHAPSVVSSVQSTQVRILDSKDGTHLEAKTPGNQTYGRDVPSIFREVMDAPERPQEVSESLRKVQQAIDLEDFEEASRLLEQLKSKVGSNDPEVTGLETTLYLEQI
ncbi:AAA family ATPase [Corynebacterium epidermidicanis]|uniref:AAA+ ATPase domain-containing protein n=1 Tax=Corynebacterium epidermidicanis TaxID=1050174 RepID=A0A0G3GR13_9CORY|nr:AAA family ATPase [Corynebacterium epidermidicanis]AKK02018.1 hypothetical protein CEPID_00620 [Corynebacterium epidermidicanis]